jgi:hypothetical protein
MPSGRLAQAINVERRGRWKASLHDHPISASGVIVARGTVDVVSLSAAAQVCGSDCEREEIGDRAIDSALIEKFICAQLAARNGSLDGRPFRTSVCKKGAGILRFVSRLHMHVLTAASEDD